MCHVHPASKGTPGRCVSLWDKQRVLQHLCFNMEECLLCPVGAAFAGMRLPQQTASQTRQHSSKQDLNAVIYSPFECRGEASLSVS